MSRFLILFINFLFSLITYSQNIFFEKKFGSVNADFGRSVKQMSDGSIYLAGYSNNRNITAFDISLSKLDQTGKLLWTKYYGDQYDNTGLYLNKTSKGNLVIVGETQSLLNGLDIILYHIDTSGNTIWSKTYGTSVNESGKYIEETNDKGFIICGFQNDSFASNDTYVLKIDSNGNKQWEKTFGGTDNEYADMIRQTQDGGYILTGDTRSFGAGGYDIQVIKLDNLGNTEWDYTFGDSLQNGCQGILQLSGGNYLSYGETNVGFQFSPFDFYLEKINPNGISIWRKVFGGQGSDAIFSAVETFDKGFVCTGYSNSYNTGPINLVIFKTDSIGNLLWIQSYGGDGIDIGYEIVPSIDDGFLVGGSTIDSSEEYYLLHASSFGLISDINNDIISPLIVYPNPFNNFVTIELPIVLNQAKLSLYNILGEKLTEETFSGQKYTLQLNSSLNSGIYIVRVSDQKEKTFHRKVFKD